MKALGWLLLGVIIGMATLVAGVLGVFGQGENLSNAIEDSDTDR